PPSSSMFMFPLPSTLLLFFSNLRAPSKIYTLSLHDALPILLDRGNNSPDNKGHPNQASHNFRNMQAGSAGNHDKGQSTNCIMRSMLQIDIGIQCAFFYQINGH